MKDKIDRFLDIVNEIDGVSDENLKEILNDKELMEIQSAVSKTADALTETPKVDIDSEWQTFSEEHLGHKRRGFVAMLSNFVSRNAAAVILCTVATLAVVAATIGVHYSVKRHNEAQQPAHESREVAELNNTVKPDTIPVTTQSEGPAEIIVFKNRSLGNILPVIAEYYGATVVFETASTKELRLYFQWDKSQSLEVIVEQMDSFEQLDIKLIDNTITVE